MGGQREPASWPKRALFRKCEIWLIWPLRLIQCRSRIRCTARQNLFEVSLSCQTSFPIVVGNIGFADVAWPFKFGFHEALGRAEHVMFGGAVGEFLMVLAARREIHRLCPSTGSAMRIDLRNAKEQRQSKTIAMPSVEGATWPRTASHGPTAKQT